MNRVSTYMITDDMQYHLRNREKELNDIQNKIASNRKLRNLRDDPLAAAKAIRFQSKQLRLNRYEYNIDMVRGEMALAEKYLTEGIDILQKINELAVRGANGTLSKDEMSYIGGEIDELLKEFITIANAKREDGRSIFAGFMSFGDAFRVIEGAVSGSKDPHITGVEYIGNPGQREVEISEGNLVKINVPGNYAFWAEKQQIYSNVDASTYQVQQDSIIRIDGHDIQLREGDNIYAIIAKINEAPIPTKAFLDPVKNSLVLESTNPHQIWVHDIEGKVMTDLGILKDSDPTPYLSIAETAQVFGGSIFDMIIHLRDSLYKGDNLAVGGSALRGIKDSITGILNSLADIGARDARMEMTYKRIGYEKTEVERMEANEIGLDLADAATELQMLENAHKATLAASARIMRMSLLDFLR